MEKLTTGEDKQNTQEPLTKDIPSVAGMYQTWFLDYASYVILERAVPAMADGLKPVQRRILHAMKEMDDGRFNKVANIIGQTMQYHPHGDASIGSAIVNLGQKNLLIETQGNWGDFRTGDGAAAPRYIEARLSAFAHAVVFNPKTTFWQLAYDGRKKEPIALPVKFPLLLAQGVEGIAVGLATKIMPHNFKELIKASIQILRGKTTDILPDFPTGGLADFFNYKQGRKGGRIILRAKITIKDNKTLLISEIPYGTTTQQVIDSIVKANDLGKIKIKKVADNTAKVIEILVHLTAGQSPKVTTDALFACTDCEVSIATNACVIMDDKPRFIGVNEMLKIATQHTVELLKKELIIAQQALKEKVLFARLEQVFIEKKIYRKIENCATWAQVLETIDKSLQRHTKQFYRPMASEDIIRLTEIKIKRLSKYDLAQAQAQIKTWQADLEETEKNLTQLTNYTIRYFNSLLRKFGRGRERKTGLATFTTIELTKVVAHNVKLYVARAGGFIGYGLKKDEYVCDCSDLADIIIFRKDGVCLVTKIAEKVFVGKDIIHVEIFVKSDARKVYNMIYTDGQTGITLAKRFQMRTITRERNYNLTTGTKGTRVLYFTANANGEAELVAFKLAYHSKAKVKTQDFDFSTLPIKGRSAKGNILTKYPVKSIALKRKGVSTLPAMSLWFDESVGQLNRDETGRFLGKFAPTDRLLAVYRTGTYEFTDFELTNRYDMKQLLFIQKFDAERPVSTIYYAGKTRAYYVKRFFIATTTLNKPFNFIGQTRGAKVAIATTQKEPVVMVTYKKAHEQLTEKIYLSALAIIKNWRAKGNRLKFDKITHLKLISSEEPMNAEQQSEARPATTQKEQLELF